MGKQETKDYSEIEWGEKLLPRDELTGDFKPSFPTDKKTYYVKANHISPRKWTIFEQLTAEIRMGKSISDLGEWITEHIRLLNNYPRGKAEFLEITQHTRELADATQAASVLRYNRALYLCTLFIVTEGESLTTWDEKTAEAKIDDWNDYGYGVEDFFTLAAIFTPKLANELTNIMANILVSLHESENTQSTDVGH